MNVTLLIGLLTLTMVLPARAARLTPTDFAYGCPVPVTDPDAVHGLILPLEVHAAVTRQDMGDLMVFNAAGEAVPPCPAQSRPAAGRTQAGSALLSLTRGPSRGERRSFPTGQPQCPGRGGHRRCGQSSRTASATVLLSP